MSSGRDREGRAEYFPATSARLRTLGRQAQAQVRVYRASGRRLPGRPRRSRFTGRAAVLVLVLCALVVALAYPTRQYIAQRARIAEQREQAEQARWRVEQLREEKARWQDPEHVKAQARERLHFVMPGETAFTFTGAGTAMDVPRSSGQPQQDRPWYDRLWASVDGADRAGSPPVHRPAGRHGGPEPPTSGRQDAGERQHPGPAAGR